MLAATPALVVTSPNEMRRARTATLVQILIVLPPGECIGESVFPAKRQFNAFRSYWRPRKIQPPRAFVVRCCLIGRTRLGQTVLQLRIKLPDSGGMLGAALVCVKRNRRVIVKLDCGVPPTTRGGDFLAFWPVPNRDKMRTPGCGDPERVPQPGEMSCYTG